MKRNPKEQLILSLALTIFIAVCAVSAGLGLHLLLPDFDASPIHYTLIAAMVVFCIGNRVAASVFVSRCFPETQEEQAAFIEEHRAACYQDPEAVFRRLGDIAALPITLLILYYLLTIGMLVTGAMGMNVTLILPILLLFMPIYRHMENAPQHLCREELVPADQLPLLHDIAKRAAKTAGIKGSIRIQIVTGESCDVSRFGSLYVIFFGTRALSVMTEEEIYACIVRTMALRPTRAEERKLMRHYRLGNLGSATPRAAGFVFDIFYSLAGVYLDWYAPLYNMAFNRYAGRRTAAIIEREGLTRAYLNAVAKSHMHDYFDFEWFSHIKEPFYAPETPPDGYEMTVCTVFRETMRQRADVWSKTVFDIIPPANYIGITLSEERALFGGDHLPAPDPLEFADENSAYFAECIKAIQSTARPIPEAAYAAARKDNYLDKIAVIEKWEASDRNWPTSELSPVINAYRFLNRYDEMEALCDRIMETEPSYFAQAHAIYEKGICLMWRYDVTGIDYIYRAMDLNQNYMEEGLKFVENYCRLCGLSDELETCRRRAANLMEAHAANHEGAGTLTHTDKLEKETALDEELPAILDYMIESGEGTIERIYLVRKVISEDFYTSAFVLYFTPGSDEDTVRHAYEAIFHYLDGYPLDRQFSLFIYNNETKMAVKMVPESLVWFKGDHQ